jgi:hypothetical protein
MIIFLQSQTNNELFSTVLNGTILIGLYESENQRHGLGKAVTGELYL